MRDFVRRILGRGGRRRALALARKMCCTNPTGDRPCGRCGQCVARWRQGLDLKVREPDA